MLDTTTTNQRALSVLSRTYTTNAVVLRRAPFGDHGALLTLLTPTEGKVPAIVRGLKRPASYLAGHLEPLALVTVGIARGRNLDVITQAQLCQVFPHLREDVYRVAVGWCAAEIIDYLLDQRQESCQTYNLFLALLRQLNTAANPDILLGFFEMRLLTILGYRPVLWQCAMCSSPNQEIEGHFAAAQGGWICKACAVTVSSSHRLSLPALNLLRCFQVGYLADLDRQEVPQPVLSEAMQTLNELVQMIAERTPRTLSLLNRIRSQRTSLLPGAQPEKLTSL